MQPLVALRKQVAQKLDQPIDTIAEMHDEHFELHGDCGVVTQSLDQTLTRANFRADLEGMSRAAKDAAIERLQLPESDPRAMPPPLLRMLTPEARSRAIEALRR